MYFKHVYKVIFFLKKGFNTILVPLCLVVYQKLMEIIMTLTGIKEENKWTYLLNFYIYKGEFAVALCLSHL